MSELDIDRRLGILLRDPAPVADAAFADRVVAAAMIDRSFRKSQRRAWRRAAIDCAAAATVGLSFFLLSQTEHEVIAGTISLEGPAMAGLIMLGLWAMVALPAVTGDQRARLMP